VSAASGTGDKSLAQLSRTLWRAALLPPAPAPGLLLRCCSGAGVLAAGVLLLLLLAAGVGCSSSGCSAAAW
jgi:hypothetical protein